jgi:hypothetical protein
MEVVRAKKKGVGITRSRETKRGVSGLKSESLKSKEALSTWDLGLETLPRSRRPDPTESEPPERRLFHANWSGNFPFDFAQQ